MSVLRTALLILLPWSLSVLASGACVDAIAQRASTDDRSGGLRQIITGHYVYLHTDDTPGVSSTVNSGIIVTNEGVVVVDALSSEAIARQVREAIAGVTAQPVRFLVSSTFHGRFTGGNPVWFLTQMYARFSSRQVGQRRGKTLRMCSCPVRSGAVVCRSIDGRLRGPRSWWGACSAAAGSQTQAADSMALTWRRTVKDSGTRPRLSPMFCAGAERSLTVQPPWNGQSVTIPVSGVAGLSGSPQLLSRYRRCSLPGFSISLWYRNPPDQFSRLDCAGSDARTPRRRVTPSG